jgi:hypothetical protein
MMVTRETPRNVPKTPPATAGDAGATEDHCGDDVELRTNEIKRISYTCLELWTIPVIPAIRPMST